jgi:site-specific recombinase XerD
MERLVRKPIDQNLPRQVTKFSLRKKILKTAALRAKIPGQIGWHTLRHSYRAWLDETGAPLACSRNSCFTPISRPR